MGLLRDHRGQRAGDAGVPQPCYVCAATITLYTQGSSGHEQRANPSCFGHIILILFSAALCSHQLPSPTPHSVTRPDHTHFLLPSTLPLSHMELDWGYAADHR